MQVKGFGNGLWSLHAGSPAGNGYFVFVGGLGDDPSFILTDLGQAIHAACIQLGYELVIPHLRSSGIGWGQSSLDCDVSDLSDLLNTLPSNSKIVMMGHSTGCQDLVHLAPHLNDPRVKLLILQAPVSDREMAFHVDPEGSTNILQLVKSLPEAQLLPQPWAFSGNPVAVTAYRVKSLLDRGGDDDYFSTDLTREERRLMRVSHPPIDVIFGDEDECFPFEERIDSYLADLKASCPAIRSIYRLPGDHSLSGLGAEVTELLVKLLSK